MKFNEVMTAPEPDIKEPATKPTTEPKEPATSPDKDDDPWKVPSPNVEPTPKA